MIEVNAEVELNQRKLRMSSYLIILIFVMILIVIIPTMAIIYYKC